MDRSPIFAKAHRDARVKHDEGWDSASCTPIVGPPGRSPLLQHPDNVPDWRCGICGRLGVGMF